MLKKSCFIFFVFLISCSHIYSLPNLTGTTGLISMPTAEILDYKQYNSAIDYQLNLENNNKSKYFYKINIGALENTELGLVGGSEPDEGVFLNFKWSLSSNSARFPLKMAVGFDNITARKKTNFYIVTSKKIRSDLGIHAGFKALFNNKISASLITGIDYSHTENIIFMADLSSKNDNYYLINSGVLFKPTIQGIENLYIRGSIENFLRNAHEDSYLNIGFCFIHLL